MERKIFWIAFTILCLRADFLSRFLAWRLRSRAYPIYGHMREFLCRREPPPHVKYPGCTLVFHHDGDRGDPQGMGTDYCSRAARGHLRTASFRPHRIRTTGL